MWIHGLNTHTSSHGKLNSTGMRTDLWAQSNSMCLWGSGAGGSKVQNRPGLHETLPQKTKSTKYDFWLPCSSVTPLTYIISQNHLQNVYHYFIPSTASSSSTKQWTPFSQWTPNILKHGIHYPSQLSTWPSLGSYEGVSAEELPRSEGLWLCKWGDVLGNDDVRGVRLPWAFCFRFLPSSSYLDFP